MQPNQEHGVEGRQRSSFALTIETAEVQGDRRRIKGVANTFGVMRSGRLIHPGAVEDWLKANSGATLPLLAQHGAVDGFATIGLVDVLQVRRSRGLYFEATLAAGTNLADQAWTLISQKLLTALSLGWIGRQARYVRSDDKDLDPWIAQELKRSGTTECYAYLAVEVLEISVVDIGDDGDAKLAARARGEASGDVAALREEVASLRRELDALKYVGGATSDTAAVVLALGDAFGEWIECFREAAIQAVLESAEALDAASALRETVGDLSDAGMDLAAVSAAARGSGGTDLATLLQRVKDGPRGGGQ